MKKTLMRLGGVEIAVTFKAVKNVRLTVRPPQGDVTLVAPKGMRLDAARAFVISNLEWIRRQQARLQGQPREAPRQYVTQESHSLWGKPYVLEVVEQDAPPSVQVDDLRITLRVRPGTDMEKRAGIYLRWQRSLLHDAVPPLIAQWEGRLGVKVASYFLQRMKTRWGSCNYRRGHIRLNTELAKKPRDMLEYVIVHELLHLIEPRHSPRFYALMDQYYPSWREARAALNALPLGA